MATSPAGHTVLYGSGLTGEIDKILKDVWEPMMQRLFTNETGFLQAFKRYSKMPDVGGRKWNVKLHIRPGQGIGSRSERLSTGAIVTTTGTDLPTPVPQTVDDCYVRPTWHYWAVSFTGQALKVAKGDPYSFAKTQTWEMSEVFNEFMYDFNRQLLGNGSGIIAKSVTTAASEGLSEAKWHNAGTAGYEWYVELQDVKQMRPGAYYAIYCYSGTAAVYKETAQCTNIDLDNNYAYFILAADAAVDDSGTTTNYLFTRAGNGLSSTTSAGVLITPTGSGGAFVSNEMMGIAGVCDDGTEFANFQNLSRATYPELKGVVQRAVGELTPLKLKKLFDNVSLRTGKRPDACIVGQGVDRAVFAVLEPYRRFVGPEVVFGYDTVPIIIDGKKIQWMVEPQLAAGQLLAPKWDTMEYWQIADPAWADDDGKILRKAPENSDLWNAFGRFFGNLVCLNPMGNARMEGISEA
jgi:hypothetical protein